MPDDARLTRLAAEYNQLKDCHAVTPQARGQRFNELVAEVLRCWDISAVTSVRTTGEVDVAFSVEGVRYVMEIKWESKPADTGRIAKLQKRVRQRLLGTYGIFLSMSGYSAPALADVADGERLEILLLDAGHFEALLRGDASPARLLSLVHDQAAFLGQAFTPVDQLLAAEPGPSSSSPARPPVGAETNEASPAPDQAGVPIFVYTGWHKIYWVLTALLATLTLLLALVSVVPFGWSVGSALGLCAAVFGGGLAIGFARIAHRPTRLIIGPMGIQVVLHTGDTWMPWHSIYRVAVASIYGGPHLVVHVDNPDRFPTMGEGVGLRPRYISHLNAVSLCALNTVKASPSEVDHALHSYAGHRRDTKS